MAMLMAISFVVAALVALLVVFFLTKGGEISPQKLRHQAAVSDSLRTLVLAQRGQLGQKGSKRKENLAIVAAAEGDGRRKKARSGSRMTIERLLRYARWPLTPLQFRGIQAVAGLILFIPAYRYLDLLVWWFLAPVIGAVICKEILLRSVNRRFKQFDADYPVLLMSYVSLLKTGLSVIPGLEAAAKGLDEGSLVRSEVELLIERLRLGLTEEQAINAFGEDIAHPEIELFVQGLLLSRRVGGQLSSTLERLARQVRKRQEFRNRAVAAVGMERMSALAVGVVLSGVIVFLAIKSPELVFSSFQHPLGLKIWQGGIGVILVGAYWMKKVTHIKV